MDCHAKWPDTRGQMGCLGGGARKEGVIVGVGGGCSLDRRGVDRLTSRVCFQVNLFSIREHGQQQHEKTDYHFDSEIMFSSVLLRAPFALANDF